MEDRIKTSHCKPCFILLTKSGDYHVPACQVIRLSWPDISSGKPSYAQSGETGLAVILSKPKLIHRAMRVGMRIVGEHRETKPCFWARGLRMCTSSMGRRTCSTCRRKNREWARECCCARLSLWKELS